MADSSPPDAVFRIFMQADTRRVWRELTKTDEARGAAFNAWLLTTGLVPGAPKQMRTGSGKRVLVVGEVKVFEPPHRTASCTRTASPSTMILNSLKVIAETGRPALTTRLMYFAFSPMEFVLPARARSEHWPLIKS